MGVKIRKAPAASRKTPKAPSRITGRPKRASAVATPGDRELLRAICHEVGNLLAATRLTAHLLTREARDPEQAASSRTIEDLAAQAGSLLAHVRIILAGAPAMRVRIAPRDLLEAVERAQPGRALGAGLRVSARLADQIRIEADPDAVHQALCALVDSAREAAGPNGSVSIGIVRAKDRASFVVTDDGPPFDEAAELASLRRGRHLVIELARAVAKRQGGDLVVRRLRRGTEVRLSLPCVLMAPPRGRTTARGASRATRTTPAPAGRAGSGRSGRATRPRAPLPPPGG